MTHAGRGCVSVMASGRLAPLADPTTQLGDGRWCCAGGFDPTGCGHERPGTAYLPSLDDIVPSKEHTDRDQDRPASPQLRELPRVQRACDVAPPLGACCGLAAGVHLPIGRALVARRVA